MTRIRKRPGLLATGAGLAISLVLTACGTRSSSNLPPPTTSPPAVVTPESGPSALQRQLAALTPTTALPPTAMQSRLDAEVKRYHERTQSRRVYIALDKPIYQPGEAIWFRTFELFSANLTGPQQNYGTSFQLISPKGAVVMQKRTGTVQGAAANDFVLPADVPGGEYTLKVITDQGVEAERSVIVSSYQPPRIKKKLEFLRKAYGPSDQVAAAVALHRATGEALASQAITGLVVLDGTELARVPVTTDSAGKAVVRFALPAQIARGDGLLTVLVDDGGVTESIQKRIPITLDRIQFAMFPEGGDLVRGLPGRVYFSAKNLIDKPADVEGRVVDDRQNIVALFKSYHNGLGRFELTPLPDRSYRVEITKPLGIAQTFDIPAAQAEGCAMQAVDDRDSKHPDLRVAVWCAQSRTVVALAVLRDARLDAASVAVKAGEPTVISLTAPSGAQGAVRVTLFDTKLKPMAERLIYRSRGQDLKVRVTPDRRSYNPRDPVTLTVEAHDLAGLPVEADLALSVVDDTVLSFADDKTAHLLARLFLESEMPGQKIEEPNLYFSDDPKAAAGLDLVLGTQGWRRFDWKQVFVPPKPIEVGWEFTGEYWDDELGYYRKNDEKLAEVEDEEATKAVVDQKAKKGKRPARRVQARREAPVAENARRLPAADPPPMGPMVAAGAMADAEEIVVMGRAAGVDEAFDIGIERKRRGVRIRDKDWGERGEMDNHWGWVPVRQFPVPNYEARYDGPRVDFRETIYWQPSVKTDGQGVAKVKFYLSDAVTSFRATAEGVSAGGLPGRGDALITSKLPVSLAVKMPLEVSAGDTIRLPVTLANETEQSYSAKLTATFGPAFQLEGDKVPDQVTLAAGQRTSYFYQLKVVGSGRELEDGNALIAIEAANLRDEVQRTIKVVPLGFPQELSLAGTLADVQRHEFELGEVLAGTLDASITLYPSPLATMVEGTEAMIREPVGCFEQASSANYPNIMVLDYLGQHEAADPDLIERTHGMLERGYNKLTGYESPKDGYEWFGGDPGHEALTAYGLMEFVDMTAVYGEVDRGMIQRTARWLKSRRDGKGGFKRSKRALDSFGRASDDVTNAYIAYALSEAKQTDLDAEVALQTRLARDTKDPYIMALATNTLLNVDPASNASRSAAKRLAGMQSDDGSYPGADHSITRSGGVALGVETTSLAALALMKAGDVYAPNVRKAIEWLDKNRSGYGGYGSTQSTVLALKTMSTYAASTRTTRASGVITLLVNGKQAGRLAYEKGHKDAIVFDDLASVLKRGKNVIELRLESKEPLPYSVALEYRSNMPASSKHTQVAMSTELAKSQVNMGESVRMKVSVTNVTDKGIPMALARVGLPGGLTFQTWQLKELRDKKLIDFYETRDREVILYFRSMAPRAVKQIALDLKADVPGDYVAPASRAYLYYTDEYKHWVKPERIRIIR